MKFLEEYEKQLEIDYVVWRSLPTTMGFWIFLATSIYLWRFTYIKFDTAAAIGVAFGCVFWLLTHLVLGMLGKELILTNLWANYGCGCAAKLLAIPLLPYFGIFGLLFWGYKVGTIGIAEFALSLILGWINWFVLNYLDAY